jgi:hypothetical protein
MSVQNISAASDPAAREDYSAAQAARAKFNQMGEAIQNGDLTQAQADYSDLMRTAPAFVQNGQGPMGKAMANLGSALQSGSVSSAQEAFQFVARHLRHRHHVAAQGSADATTSSASSASGASSGSNVLDVRA